MLDNKDVIYMLMYFGVLKWLSKGTILPKTKICWKIIHAIAIQHADEFVSSLKEIWTKKIALHHLFTNGSSAVNGCRQNESPNSLYKHHNNPQVIHMTHVYQLIYWSKNLYVPKKQTHRDIFLSESGERYAWIKHCLQTVQNTLNKICWTFWCERTKKQSGFLNALQCLRPKILPLRKFRQNNMLKMCFPYTRDRR